MKILIQTKAYLARQISASPRLLEAIEVLKYIWNDQSLETRTFKALLVALAALCAVLYYIRTTQHIEIISASIL